MTIKSNKAKRGNSKVVKPNATVPIPADIVRRICDDAFRQIPVLGSGLPSQIDQLQAAEVYFSPARISALRATLSIRHYDSLIQTCKLQIAQLAVHNQRYNDLCARSVQHIFELAQDSLAVEARKLEMDAGYDDIEREVSDLTHAASAFAVSMAQKQQNGFAVIAQDATIMQLINNPMHVLHHRASAAVISGVGLYRRTYDEAAKGYTEQTQWTKLSNAIGLPDLGSALSVGSEPGILAADYQGSDGGTMAAATNGLFQAVFRSAWPETFYSLANIRLTIENSQDLVDQQTVLQERNARIAKWHLDTKPVKRLVSDSQLALNTLKASASQQQDSVFSSARELVAIRESYLVLAEQVCAKLATAHEGLEKILCVGGLPAPPMLPSRSRTIASLLETWINETQFILDGVAALESSVVRTVSIDKFPGTTNPQILDIPIELNLAQFGQISSPRVRGLSVSLVLDQNHKNTTWAGRIKPPEKVRVRLGGKNIELVQTPGWCDVGRVRESNPSVIQDVVGLNQFRNIVPCHIDGNTSDPAVWKLELTAPQGSDVTAVRQINIDFMLACQRDSGEV